MTWNQQAGLDPDQLLMVNLNSLDKIAGHFKSLKEDIDEVRGQFRAQNSDLGMQECEEGRTWDSKVNEARTHVYDALSDFYDTAEQFEARMGKIRQAYNAMDDKNKQSFTAPERSAGWPQESVT